MGKSGQAEELPPLALVHVVNIGNIGNIYSLTFEYIRAERQAPLHPVL